ncbi:hypothetical protein QWY84_02080 [Aquisalimonas lutea]|uniref:hypothetical protein n=1 Tax=Aquisalimonas lutea TaxID=1327750 RepID=UPI0025B47878|nr:hypothetical protein [Aquisalimonas lutea]MDN3516387.1 hypothetical protein [Aquisalimonas lutea]
MKPTLLKLTVLLGVTVFSGHLYADEQSCDQNGYNAPLELHKHWIMEGWEKQEGDPEFVFAEKMNLYYDLEQPEGVFFDNFAPGEIQLFDNALVYGRNWEGLQAEASSVLHALTEGHSELVGGEVASTTIGFVGTIDRRAGSIIPFKGRSQIGWDCDNGQWKIRQELNYAWIVTREEIAHYYDALEAVQ